MISFESIRLKFRSNIYIPLTKNKMRKKLKNTNFTIISNNCWGGCIYESYGIRKNSPTIGLFFMAEDYLKFIKNIKYYLNCDIEFINTENSKWKKELEKSHNWGKYPIGKIDNIEIFFLHYKSKEEVINKWNRRRKRINWDRLLIKFNDQNGCTEKHIEEFANMPYKNKICFTIKNYYKYNCVFKVGNGNKRDLCVSASKEPLTFNKKVNITKIINEL